MNKSIKVKCPAKINLSLKVLNKREDGFHNIESIMQTINLFDFLTISVSSADYFKIILNGNSKEIPYNEKNLIFKAAKLFFDSLKIKEKFIIKIFVEKNIPVSAGLAGGSTDAAGTLFGINELLNKPFSQKKLHSLCSKLGSDLNFCLDGGKKKTFGRGDILENMDFEDFSLSLIKPKNIGISAKEAYEKFDGLKNKENNFKNDLEFAVFYDFKELKHIKEKYPNAIMSGSGSAFFVIGDVFKEEKGFWVKNNLKSISSGVAKV